MNRITITVTTPSEPACLQLQDALSDHLQALTGSSGRASFDPQAWGKNDFFLLAQDENQHAVGCVAVRSVSDTVGEIKRMYARPGTRGVGAQLLHALEAKALAQGYCSLWLETRRINQRALDFYLRNGYCIRENYGRYVGNPQAVCFEKTLVPPAEADGK
ncbi:GNAT family N-acetyltransferase [Kosakonia sp. ML.JS2a]|uniref:GNAT family N-acetyltransferase n=1 Tax=Kosakonia sp. ML.JS2a TaxID=2980557 RepID=UPI0021D97B10|nr:GNAT family N-acetyltransferase [Kosakonia sp. ML.JS2a]UXY13185.1 GNAT family N-acetyltransferase [Kosakonia sp. ML.JS2a]